MSVIRGFEENDSLWNLVIPGRDTREAELGMVDEELKEVLSNEALDKIMHAGVLAYASSCYMLDVMEELLGIEESEKRVKLQALCLKRVIQDLIFGVQGSYCRDDDINHLIDWSSGVFETAMQDV